MSKLLVLGIDSMDRDLLNEFRQFMPNITKLMENSPPIHLKGVFPPDSTTSWASIYTGLNPAEHGILHFTDPLERITNLVNKEIEHEEIVGKTFFDHLDSEGFKVASFFALLTFPPWKLKSGAMISRPTTNKGYIQAIPTEYKSILEQDFRYNPYHHFEAKNTTDYLKYMRNLLKTEFDTAKKFIGKESWNLFFLYTSVLDTIQHDFWSHFDKRDPDYNPNSQYINVIRDFYEFVDEEVGKVTEEFKDYDIIIISDHGHNIRPVRIININEILRREGLLIIKGGFLVGFIEKIKNKTREIIFKFNLAKYALKVLRVFPRVKDIYTKPVSLNKKETLVSLSDLSGIKSYPYGGITINSKKLDRKKYLEIRDEVIKLLEDIKDPVTDTYCFKWIKSREELYSGQFVKKFPDILFQTKDLLGAGWSFGKKTPIFENIDSHSISPGCHQGESPVLIINTKIPIDSILKDKSSMDLMDIADIIKKITRAK